MNEILKAIKIIYNLIVVSSFSLLVLLIPERLEKNPYSEALEEIELYVEICKEYYSKVHEVKAQHFISQGSNEVLKGIDYFSYHQMSGFYQSDLESISEDLPEGYGDLESKILLYKFDFQEYSDTLNEIVNNIIRKNSLKRTELQWGIFGRGGSTINLGFVKKTNAEIHFPGMKIFIKGKENYNVDCIDKLKAKRILVSVEGDDKLIAFPKLRKIWGEVKLNTIEEALENVKLKSDLSRKQRAKPLKFLGFEFEKEYVIIFGPLLIFSFLLYMFLHTIKLTEFKDKSELANFPWIGIYSSDWARSVFIGTIFFLPMVALFLALLDSEEMVLSIFIFILMVFYFFIIKEVFKTLGELSPPKENSFFYKPFKKIGFIS